MDTVKKAQPILTVANTAGLIGVTVYFYRAITALQSQQVRISSALQSTIDAVNAMKKEDRTQTIMNGVQTLDEELNAVKEELDLMASLDELEEVKLQLDELIHAAKESGIEVARIRSPRNIQVARQPPKREPRQTAKSRVPSYRRRSSLREELEDEDTIEPVTRNPISAVRASRRS